VAIPVRFPFVGSARADTEHAGAEGKSDVPTPDTSSMTIHRCVQIGCGSRAQTHVGALSDSDRFELAAVCDLDRERAAETADRFDIEGVHTDLHEAVTSAAPAHVSVVTPPSVRLSVVTGVLDHDVDSVLLEKPLANSLEEAQAITDALAEAEVRGTVCHQTPWSDELRALASWMDDDRIGDLRRLVATTKHGLAAQGTHLIHSLNWLVGRRPTEVRAFASGESGLAPGGHVEPDDAVFELTYGGALRAFLHEGVSAPDEPAQADTFSLEYRIDAAGTRGTMGMVLGDHAQLVTGAVGSGDGDAAAEHVEARPFDEDAYMTRGLYDRLGAVLAGEVEDHPADVRSALAAQRVVDAAMRSAVERRAVGPAETPPTAALGQSSPERLRRRLVARRPLVVSSLLYHDTTFETAVQQLSRLGVSAVDLWSMPAFAEHLDPASPEDARETLDAHGIDVPVVSVYDSDPVEERLRAAAAVGAEAVVMGGRSPDRPETWEPETTRSHLDLAADLGLTLAFENHLDSLETVGEMESLLDALDHPAAGICLAPPHLVAAGGDPVEALARLGDAVEVAYVWDTEPGVTPETADEIWWDRADSQVPGGGGSLDVEAYLDAAAEHAPGAEWVLCYHGTEDWGLDRIGQSVARGARVVEHRRPS
jgi:predicted dehydrogenase/sugar phosphate isomerase/epimerase